MVRSRNSTPLPTDAANMVVVVVVGGGEGVCFSKFDGGLKSIHGRSMGGGGLKCCRKIPVEEFI